MRYKRLELDGKVAVVIGGSSGIGRTLGRPTFLPEFLKTPFFP